MNKYLNFIEHCKKKKYHSNEYLEKHHIVPRHSGGTDGKENIIKLSLRDHILAHKIRYETYGNKYDLSAYHFMIGQSKEAKKAICSQNGAKSRGRKLTDEHKLKLKEAFIGEKNHFYGKTHTEDAKQKIREKAIGRAWKEESKNKLKETFKNNPNLTRPRQCEINGKIYNSASEAAKELSIEKSLLNYRLNSKNYSEYIWIGEQRKTRSANAIKVEINGIIYESFVKAGSALNMHPGSIAKRCRSKDYPEYKILS